MADFNYILNSNPASTPKMADLQFMAGQINTPKVYRALLTQTGTDAPVATVLENTIGDIVWTYEDVGVYQVNNLLFTQNKTYCPQSVKSSGQLHNNLYNSGNSTSIYIGVRNEYNSIVIQVNDNALQGLDGMLINFPIEILVYP